MNSKEIDNLDLHWYTRSVPHRETQARAEHIRILLRHSIYVLLGNIAASLTLAVGLWSTAQHDLMIAWILATIVLNVTRWVVGRRFPTGFINDAEMHRWERRFIFSVAISGILWGTAGSLFYIPDNPEYSLFLALLIIGMCAAAPASLSYHRTAYQVFLLPAITPITLHLISDSHLTVNAMGLVIPFYFTLLYLLSREIYQTAHESIVGRINSQYQAMFDHLTGIENRRAFEETLDREWYRAMRDMQMLSLVIADIDNFKLCNDTYGHAVGDQVLKAIAALLEQRIRRGNDLVARIGGEEFAIILPDTDLDGAVTLVESIRADIEKLASAHNHEIPRVTMSFGAASIMPDESLDMGLLFRSADAAVYRAKQKGKDRVETMDAYRADNKAK
jgi:diguanylate cyclase (GGDEF)-like protein